MIETILRIVTYDTYVHILEFIEHGTFLLTMIYIIYLELLFGAQ